MIEKIKEFWDNRPCNIGHSFKTIGTREYFEQVEKKRYFVEPHITSFANFDKWKGKKVLEVGCGIGTDTIGFARAGAIVTAIDISKKSIELVKKRFELYGLSANILYANAEDLASYIEKEKYDLIYSFGVIHHSPNPERIVQSLKYYCHEQTELRFMLYSKFSIKVIEILLRAKSLKNIDKLIARSSEAQPNSPITYTYFRFQVRKLLRDYRIKSIKKRHIFPWKVSEYKNNIYVKRTIFRLLPLKLLEKILGWHWLVVATPK